MGCVGAQPDLGGYGKPPNGSPEGSSSGVSIQAVGQPTLEHGRSSSQAGAVGVALGSLFKLRAQPLPRWTHQTLGLGAWRWAS